MRLELKGSNELMMLMDGWPPAS